MRELEQQINAIGRQARRSVAYYFTAALAGPCGIAVLLVVHVPALRGLGGTGSAAGVAADPATASAVGWALLVAAAGCYCLSRRRYL